MDAKEIKDLLKYVRSAGFQEFELRMNDFRLRVVRDQPALPPTSFAVPGSVPAALPPQGVSAPSAASAAPSASAAEANVQESAPESARESGVVEQTSPMVGTFYRAPSPGADPFVQAGDRVAPGQTLGIIEAMKLMNEIEAEFGGTLVEVVPENAQPVEYGEVLFRIRPGE